MAPASRGWAVFVNQVSEGRSSEVDGISARFSVAFKPGWKPAPAKAVWRGHPGQVVAAQVSVGGAESGSSPPRAGRSGLPLRELAQVTSSLSSPKASFLPPPLFPPLFLIPESTTDDGFPPQPFH